MRRPSNPASVGRMSPDHIEPPTSEGRPKVLVAGGGVAALETMLALRDLAGERVEIELLSPEAAFRYRPLDVAAVSYTHLTLPTTPYV